MHHNARCTYYTQKLHKVSCQSSHFVFRLFRISTASSASPTSTPPRTASTVHGVSHGSMFKLHKVLEERIAENTAGVLGLTSRKWSAGLVEVHHN